MDVIRYAQANGLFAQALGNFSDVQFLRLKMAQLHVFLHSRQKILKGKKHPTDKADQEVQFVSNFSSYTTPNITRMVQTL